MTKLEYFKSCLNNDNLLKLNWYYTFFTILQDKENEFIKIDNNKAYVKVDGKEEELIDHKDFPILSFKTPINLEKGILSNLKDNIETTVGRVISNKVLLEYNFGNKLDYINKQFSIGDIESILAKKLQNKEVSVNEYLKFCDSTVFLTGLSSITNISATYKNILPPPNLDKIKKELAKKYNEQYGPNWVKDRLRVVEYQEELKKVDEEWLKDDPSNNKLINKKIKGNARAKMFLTFGSEVGFVKDGSQMTFVPNSLMEQYSNDSEQITAMFNSARSGSYDRGKETQKGGAAAKDILRALSSYNISIEDCGSTLGKLVLVTKENAESLKNRYIISNGKVIKLENTESYIGKYITLRSPMYCKTKDSSYCQVCVGGLMSQFKTAINLIGTNISNILLTTSLKTMHNSQVNLTKLDIKNIIS